MSKKTACIIQLSLFIIGLIIIYYTQDTTCNKPGSVAEQINWAGHNCPR